VATGAQAGVVYSLIQCDGSTRGCMQTSAPQQYATEKLCHDAARARGGQCFQEWRAELGDKRHYDAMHMRSKSDRNAYLRSIGEPTIRERGRGRNERYNYYLEQFKDGGMH
jgi:hypothetical protein